MVDILDRLLKHDSWTTRQLLLTCRDLTHEQLDREIDIGHRTVRRTLQHVIRNMEVWTDLIAEQPVRSDSGSQPPDRSVDGLLQRLDTVAAELAEVANRIPRESRWDECFTDHLDDPPTQKTFGGAIAHVITHSMHHRAQLLYMLRVLGVRDLIEGDVLSWESQHESDAAT